MRTPGRHTLADLWRAFLDEQIQRGRRLREHCGRAQRQVADVLEDADLLGLAENHTEQRERIEVRRLVRAVLDREQVIAEPVGKPRRLEHPAGVPRVRDQEVPELDLMAVVGHGGPVSRSQNPTGCRMRTTWMRPGISWWISRIFPTKLFCP